MNDLAKNLVVWLIVAVVLIAVFQNFSANAPAAGELSYNQFIEEVKADRVKAVTIADNGIEITGVRKDGSEFNSAAPQDDKLMDTLFANGVQIVQEKPPGRSLLLSILFNFLPVLLIIGFWFFMMRQMQQGGGKGAMSFGKSRAKLQGENEVKVTLADVAGCEEAKEEVGELVEFLRDPGRFQKLGGKIPRGVLMVGPPGTGKTLLARAIAGEAKVPFFSISGSDFVEMFVGVGASRVRDMFETAKKHAPCIIFIDEIDAVGRHRGAGLGGGHDEREQTLNQLLVEMDGFEGGEGVIVVAATNRPTCSTPRCCARAASTARSWSACRTSRAASRSSRCTCARCRWPTTSSRSWSRAARPASRVPTSRTSSTRRRCSPRARTPRPCAWSTSTVPATRS